MAVQVLLPSPTDVMPVHVRVVRARNAALLPRDSSCAQGRCLLLLLLLQERLHRLIIPPSACFVPAWFQRWWWHAIQKSRQVECTHVCSSAHCRGGQTRLGSRTGGRSLLETTTRLTWSLTAQRGPGNTALLRGGTIVLLLLLSSGTARRPRRTSSIEFHPR